jgi:hypothetical protein
MESAEKMVWMTPDDDATAELARGFETRAATKKAEKTGQPSLFSPEELPPRLLNLKEAAEFLRMSKAWVRDHATRREPRIACVRWGSRRARLLFRPCDLVEFVDKYWQSAEGPFPKRP